MVKRVGAFLTAAVVVVVAVAGCASSTSASSTGVTGASASPKVAWISPLGVDRSSKAFESAISCEAQRVGGSSQMFDGNGDVNRQLTDTDTAIAQGFNALVTLPLDPVAYRPAIERAAAQGVAVVELFNPDTTAAGAVLEDSKGYGPAAIDYVKKNHPEVKSVAIIGGPPIPIVKARVEGFRSAAEAAGMTVVNQIDTPSPSVDEGRKTADDMLTKNPDIGLILTEDDASAIGAGLAVKARGLNVLTMGVGASGDAVQAIKDGTVTVIFNNDPFEQGVQAVKQAEQILAGQNPQPFTLPIMYYDKQNVNTFVPLSDRCK